MFEEALFALVNTKKKFKGYHKPHIRWNGWACPYFEFKEAMDITNFINTFYDYTNGEYYTDIDTFIFRDDDVFSKVDFKGVDIEVNGEIKHVYQIGSGYWTWDIYSKETVEGGI